MKERDHLDATKKAITEKQKDSLGGGQIGAQDADRVDEVEGTIENTAKADLPVGGEPDTQSAITADQASEAVDQGVNSAAQSQSKDAKPAAKERALAPGVFPFTLPPFAAPFLFIPPYLEVSFTTCSAIYLRHPTITANPRNRDSNQPQYLSDIPSPYPATGDIFSLAWELYAHDAPRIRSDLRRLRVEARSGRSGLRSARARDQWRKVLAIRRKRDRDTALTPVTQDAVHTPTEFLVGGRSAAVRRSHLSATAA
jgi:hypothetical protein